ncbi:hypothetical protein [Mangrovicoccus sp. HB161399]|uniref:hypothetical protein n=1 Tax=Mangrovicoccus sp. HB161399 TaxID=2720392 RepID=UPI001557D49B|nr:hypothetical protein [Mangrovicoccus sp. HB161399]
MESFFGSLKNELVQRQDSGRAAKPGRRCSGASRSSATACAATRAPGGGAGRDRHGRRDGRMVNIGPVRNPGGKFAQPFDPSQDLIEIERERHSLHGREIISVGAAMISGGHASYYRLVRLDSDGKRHLVELACLMPSREERAQHGL